MCLRKTCETSEIVLHGVWCPNPARCLDLFSSKRRDRRRSLGKPFPPQLATLRHPGFAGLLPTPALKDHVAFKVPSMSTKIKHFMSGRYDGLLRFENCHKLKISFPFRKSPQSDPKKQHIHSHAKQRLPNPVRFLAHVHLLRDPAALRRLYQRPGQVQLHAPLLTKSISPGFKANPGT